MLGLLVAVIVALFVFKRLRKIALFVLRVGLVITVSWLIVHPLAVGFIPGAAVVALGLLGSVRSAQPVDLRAPKPSRGGTARTSVRS